MSIGERISKLRKQKNLSQQKLADILFVSDKTVSSWEIDRTEPSLEMIVNLSKLFDCTPSYLIYGDINRSDIETEIKIKIDKSKYQSLITFLDINAEFINESNHLDVYYEPAHRSFTNQEVIKEWLRIGKRGNKNILTYKNWYDVHCDEYEVEIDDIDKMYKIFDVLNFKQISKVDKNRRKYIYLNKYEISLDNVKYLGYFIEIEVIKYDNDVMQEYDNLLKLAKDLELNLDDIDKKGYPYYFIDRGNK